MIVPAFLSSGCAQAIIREAIIDLQKVVEQSFDKVVLDAIGSFPKSTARYQFVLVVNDYVTRYPEAVPMKTVTVPKVAEELIRWIIQVRIPQEILSDQGTNFM